MEHAAATIIVVVAIGFVVLLVLSLVAGYVLSWLNGMHDAGVGTLSPYQQAVENERLAELTRRNEAKRAAHQKDPTSRGRRADG